MIIFIIVFSFDDKGGFHKGERTIASSVGSTYIESLGDT